MTVRIVLLGALASLMAAACGGGGSSSPATPVVNLSPAFTSAATVTVPENTGGVVYVVAASDPEGAAITYAIAGGADAARFTVNLATREMRFVVAPDFEAPTDANADNVYEIQLSASDGVNTALLALRVTVSNSLGGFAARRIASGLNAPIFVAGLPDGSGRIAVALRAGVIRIMNPTTGVFEADDFLNVSTQLSTDGERGLLALAFSPNFATDRAVFLHMNNTAGDTEIRRYQTVAGSPARADPATADAILTVVQPAGLSNHKGGMLAFDRDGRLLIGMGDGGGGGDPLGSGQNPNTLLGKLLRIDVGSDAFPADTARDYAIPTGNAFPGGVGGLAEIRALGLRNPFRGSVDPVTGDTFIGDVGQGAVEEVDRLPSAMTGPVNYGWNRREGTQPYNGGADSAAFTAPVAEYLHGSGPLQGNSITGGVVYRGPAESLQGEYVFADFTSNNIWSIPIANLAMGSTVAAASFTNRTAALTPNAGAIGSIVAFGTDTAGNLYIVDIGGEIFRVEATN